MSKMKPSTVIRATILLLSAINIYRTEAQKDKQTGWSKWTVSKCSVTCGVGKIKRARKCLGGVCRGRATAVRRCRVPPRWSKWSVFQPCDATCGKGKRIRTRKCMCGNKCKGKRTNIRPCTLKPCPRPVDDSGFTFWSKYGRCSTTCGGGIQSRTRKCPGGNCLGHLREVRNCRVKRCPGATPPFWGKYGSCSVTCGAGMKSRFKGSIEQKITCVMPECTFPVDGYAAWSNYGKCSVNCGGGIQKRTRSCMTDNCSKHNTEIRNCKTNICPADKCRNKRGAKFCRQRKSQCNSTSIANWCNLTCKKCPGVSKWSKYGPCSAKCGAGLRTRMKGGVRQSITCFGTNCDSTSVAPTSSATVTSTTPKSAIWGPWINSTCTVTCGGGTMKRTRECQGSSNCDGPDTETINCQTEICPAVWLEWSDWTTCTQTCGGGMRLRARTCTIQSECHTLPGDSTQRALCNENLCPEWQEWSEWSPCTHTCGNGMQQRERSCSVLGGCNTLEGNPSESKSCNVKACPKWQDWTDWSSCTLACGGGTITRYRSCSVIGECEGEASQTTNCNTEECVDNHLGSWSKCSKSCGEGTRNRQNCTSGTCIQEFEGCNNGNCSAVSCGATSLTLTHRYDSNHKCCNKTIIEPGPYSCGKGQSDSSRRVIGGKDAAKGRWSWMAAVQSTMGFCAGSIISENFVLTAAHCFASDSGQPYNTTTWRIIPGILLLTEAFAATRYKIASTYIHPDYSFPKADIALVKLTENIKFGVIQPICLPRGERPPIDSTCYVTGWGVSTVPDSVTSHLQELGILNLDTRVCINGYSNIENLKRHMPFLKSNQGYLCAGSLTRAVDSCSGDSGGPLVCQRCNSCTWYIAGVVSLGPNPCATIGAPGVYSDVQYYEEWILDTTGLPKHSVSCSHN